MNNTSSSCCGSPQTTKDWVMCIMDEESFESKCLDNEGQPIIIKCQATLIFEECRNRMGSSCYEVPHLTLSKYWVGYGFIYLFRPFT